MMRPRVIVVAVSVVAAWLVPVGSAAAEVRPDEEIPLEQQLAFVHPESVTIEGDLFLTPPFDLTFARLRMTDPSVGQVWDISTIGDDLRFTDASSSFTALRIEDGQTADNSLYFAADGDLGSGTVSPEAAFHLVRSNGTASIRVDETSGAVARRELFELRNNGQAAFTIRDLVGGAGGPNTWQFATRGGDAFEINKGGTGGTEFLIRASGRVTMGPGPATTFDLAPNGNLTIGGSLTEGSSRAVKTGLEAIDPRAVLASVRDLALWEWSYRSDDAVRHLGPMAEDFRAVFGLGASDGGLASLDTSGVALAAVQGLAGEVDERVAELEAENALLRARLADLEEAVADLANR